MYACWSLLRHLILIHGYNEAFCAIKRRNVAQSQAYRETMAELREKSEAALAKIQVFVKYIYSDNDQERGVIADLGQIFAFKQIFYFQGHDKTTFEQFDSIMLLIAKYSSSLASENLWQSRFRLVEVCKMCTHCQPNEADLERQKQSFLNFSQTLPEESSIMDRRFAILASKFGFE